MIYSPPSNKKPVHKPKNWDKVPVKKRFGSEGYLLAQEKIDGVFTYGLLTKEDQRIFSRTGKQCHSLGHLSSALRYCTNFLGNYVVLWETFRAGWTVNRINGAFSKQTEPFIEAVAYIHDVIPLDDFIKGRCSIPWEERYKVAHKIASYHRDFRTIPYSKVYSIEDAEAYAYSWIAMGREGAVFKKPTGTWEAGKQNDYMLKIKQELSYDLEVTGMTRGDANGKYAHTLGTLECRFRYFGEKSNEEVYIQVSGMSDKQRDLWWKNPGEIIGSIVKVDAMRFTEYGLLREPRFKEVRHDKEEADL